MFLHLTRHGRVHELFKGGVRCRHLGSDKGTHAEKEQRDTNQHVSLHSFLLQTRPVETHITVQWQSFFDTVRWLRISGTHITVRWLRFLASNIDREYHIRKTASAGRFSH